MRTKTTSRRLLREWGSLISNLKPGDSLEVTNRGATSVIVTKPARAVRRKLPDFAKISRRDDSRVGNRLLKRLLAEDETVS